MEEKKDPSQEKSKLLPTTSISISNSEESVSKKKLVPSLSFRGSTKLSPLPMRSARRGDSTPTSSSVDLTTSEGKTDKHKEELALIKMVEKNNLSKIKKLLTKPIDVNYINKHGFTALHYACMHQNEPVIRVLLAHNTIDASLCDKHGKRPHDYLEPSVVDFEGLRNALLKNSVLHLSQFCAPHRFNIKTLIVQQKINDRDDQEVSPLIWTVCTGQEKFLKKLLCEPLLDVNYKDSFFGTALHYAALLALPSSIDLLLQDYRTNSLIKNEYGLIPQQCICKEHSSLRIAFFSHHQLLQTIKEETFNVLIDNKIQEFPSSDKKENKKILLMIVKAIKERIQKLKEHQSTELPENAYIPEYVTEELLFKMIHFRYISMRTTIK